MRGRAHISTAQRAELMEVYPLVKSGHSDSVETTRRKVRLHNDVFGTRYRESTGCRACLSSILKNIKTLYNENSK